MLNVFLYFDWFCINFSIINLLPLLSVSDLYNHKRVWVNPTVNYLLPMSISKKMFVSFMNSVSCIISMMHLKLIKLHSGFKLVINGKLTWKSALNHNIKQEFGTSDMDAGDVVICSTMESTKIWCYISQKVSHLSSALQC